MPFGFLLVLPQPSLLPAFDKEDFARISLAFNSFGVVENGTAT